MILIVDKIIDDVVTFFNISIEELKEDKEKYERLKNTISNKINYIQLCDLEYLDDIEENKERIERCCEFRKMVYDEIVILLHDNKKTVLDTHKRHKINIIKN
jgi:FtsZ-binding cell division protein ZapB